jgi:NAD(P)H-dependent flavin oxidoreductase YrpB (nitropropane dioxygenase family)
LQEIITAVKPLVPEDFPLMCAGGVSTREQLKHLQDLGYAGAQLGTRFLATHEAKITDAYKEAIGEEEQEGQKGGRAATMWEETRRE